MKEELTEITDIEKLLKKVEKPSISEYRKNLLKANLMNQIETGQEVPMSRSLVRVAEFVKSAAESVRVSTKDRVMMKEDLFESMHRSRFKVFISGLRFSGRRFVSSMAVASMVFGLVSFVTVDVNVALAESFTVVEELSGDVSLYRKGVSLDVYKNMAVLEGDEVMTGKDGFVSITFVDESVLRLSEETDISVNHLVYDLRDKTKSYIEIEVQKGSVWSRVLNLFGDDSVFVVKAGEFFTKAKKAAFNIKVDELETSVEVYHHVVDVETSAEGKTKVAGGERVVSVQNSKPQLSAFREEDENSWVKQNLEDDKVYVAKVEEKKKEAREVAAVDSLKPFKSLKTGVQKYLTFDDISQAKNAFNSVQQGFVEVEVMLETGEISYEDAKVVLDGFVEEVDRFKRVIENVRENGDDIYANELKSYLSEELSQYKKDLAAVLPESPLYAAKEVVLAAEVVAAEGDEEMIVVKAGQVSVKLAEASDLAEAGRDDLAKEALDDYADAVEEATREVGALGDTKGREKALEDLADAVEGGVGVVDSLTEDELTVIVDVDIDVVDGEGAAQAGDSVLDQKPLDPLLEF